MSIRTRPKIHNIIEALVKQLQIAEDTLNDMYIFTYIETAFGKQLDEIGDIVGIDRTSIDDDVYRSDIIFQIYINTSNGEPETLISVYRDIIDAVSVSYSEIHPAGVILNAISTQIPPPDIQTKMESISPSGVKLYLTYSLIGDDSFGFSEENGTPTTGLGFSEDGYPAGDSNAGRIVELIS